MSRAPDGWHSDAALDSIAHDIANSAGDIGEKAADAIEQLRTHRDALLASLKAVLALIDSGWLVRDISRDHEPGFAMRQIAPVRTLAEAAKLADIGDFFAPAPDEPLRREHDTAGMERDQ